MNAAVCSKLTFAPPRAVGMTSRVGQPPIPAQRCDPGSQSTHCTASSCVSSLAGTDRLAPGGRSMVALSLGGCLIVALALGVGVMAIGRLLCIPYTEG